MPAPAYASPCYIISDTHVGATPPSVEHGVLRLLEEIKSDARSLVINGDLFDFWFEWRTVIPRKSYRVLAALADLRERGINILWIAGNHDCWGGEMLRTDVGVTYHVGPWVGELAGWRTRIEHGDGLRQRADRRYRALRTVLRARWAISAFRWLHPDIATPIAAGSSHASRTTRAKDQGAGLRAVALDRLASDPTLELVLFGHSHVPTLERAPGGGVYANAGSWLESPPTYLRVTPDEIVLRQWNGTLAGPELAHAERQGEDHAPVVGAEGRDVLGKIP
jgi:UDP-2,3-diacylglucosamine hydrolase